MKAATIHASDCNCNCAELLEIARNKSLAQLNKEIMAALHKFSSALPVVSLSALTFVAGFFMQFHSMIGIPMSGILIMLSLCGFSGSAWISFTNSNKYHLLQRVKNFQLELAAAKLNEPLAASRIEPT